MENRKDFLREVCKIAIPVTLQCMLQSSFSIIDQVMIGQMGSVSIAAIGLAGKFASIFNVVIAAVGTVAGIMISQYLGAGDKSEAKKSLNLNMLISIAIGVIFTFICIAFPCKVMGVYSEDMATIETAAMYLRILAISYIPLAINTCACVMFRCNDKASIPLYITVAGALINTILNYVLIFGHFGAPVLGVKGAAIATVVSAVISTIILIIFLGLFYKKEGYEWSISCRLSKMSKKEYLVILVPIFINEFLWSVGENVYASIYGHIGTGSCAAMTLTNPIQGLMIGGLSGFAAAAGIIIGKRLGAREYQEAYSAAKRILWYGFVGSIVLSVLLVAFRGFYVNIYNVEAEVKLVANQLLIAVAILVPIKVLNMILGGGVIRSGGNTKLVMYIDLIGTWLIGVPVGFISAYVFDLSIVYVYFLLSMEEAVRLIISFIIFKKKSWMRTI